MSKRTVTIRTLVNSEVTDAQCRRISSILYEAFKDDVAVQEMSGNDPARLTQTTSAYTAASVLAGVVDVASIEGSPHDFDAIALWSPPGRDFLETPEERAAGWDGVVASWTPKLTAWWTNVFPIENQRCQDFTGNVHKTGWYLSLLAVDPAYQGKGLGSGLLRYGGTRADKDGLPSVLECEEHNRQFYEALGYEVKGTVHPVGVTRTWASCACRREPKQQSAN